MSYAIVNVVWGLPLIDRVVKLSVELGYKSLDECGFVEMYSGSADTPPGYCGAWLCEFNECSKPFLASSLNLVPTPEQKSEAYAEIAKLPGKIRKLYYDLGIDPGTYFVFSTS